jgi:hypothetical protein
MSQTAGTANRMFRYFFHEEIILEIKFEMEILSVCRSEKRPDGVQNYTIECKDIRAYNHNNHNNHR